MDDQEVLLLDVVTGMTYFFLITITFLCLGLCFTCKYCFPLCTFCRDIDLNAKEPPTKSLKSSSTSPKIYDLWPKKVATKSNVNDIVLHCPNEAGPGSEIQLNSPYTGRLIRITVPEDVFPGFYFIYTEPMTEDEKIRILNRDAEEAKIEKYDLPMHGCCTYMSISRADQWTQVFIFSIKC